MAIGDDAAAAGMALVPGTLPANQIDTEINRTRDYIAQKDAVTRPVAKGGTGSTTASGARTNLGLGTVATESVVPVAKGGTGATSTSAARSNLGAAAATDVDALEQDVNALQAAMPGKAPLNHNHAASDITSGTLPIGRGGTGATTAAGARSAIGAFSASGGTLPGDFGVVGQSFFPNAYAASSGYVVAYLNSDGRLSKGASSERFKTAIDRTPDVPDVFAVPIAAYVMREDPDEVTRYGPIAEDLDANPATALFVVYDAEGRPESFDVISFLMAALARLNARLEALEG